MSFIELELPKIRRRFESIYLGDKARIAFPKVKSRAGKSYTLLNLYFGVDIGIQLGFKKGDRVVVAIDEECPLIWHIRKSPDETGWKLIAIKPTGVTPFKLQMNWNREIPGTADTSYKFVSWDIYQGGIRLMLPGITQEEKERHFKSNP